MQNKNLNELLKIIDTKVNIANIVGDYISLEKKGQNYVGLCPFHSDSNPSMSVSESKGIFKCFSCGAGGNVINFVQNFEGISFIEAIKTICNKEDIDYKPFINEQVIKINPDLIKAWAINNDAYNFFKYTLDNSEQKIKNYLNKRDITKKVIENFKIGFSGNGKTLSNFLISKGYSEDEIIKYGLAKRKNDTTLIDYFINRIMFSIEDINGNIIGFSGRVIDNDDKYVKYLNSPETISFKKSNVLYNIANAKGTSSLKKELIIVEGFMDVIALYKADIVNVVGTMGTALTREHIKMISTITKNINLAFDNDVAGINATINNGKKLIEEKFNVSIIEVSEEKDFDDLYKLGIDKILNTIKERKPFIDYYKERIFKIIDVSNVVKRSELFEKLFEVISLYKDNQLIINSLANEIHSKYEIEKNVIYNYIYKNDKLTNDIKYKEDFIPKDNFKKDIEKKDFFIKYDFLEKLIISFAMQNDFAKKYLIENNMNFLNSYNHKIWSYFLEKNIDDITDLNIKNTILELKNMNTKVIFKDMALFVNDVNDFAEIVNKNKNNIKKFHRKRLLEDLKKARNDDEIRTISKVLNDMGG